MSPPGPGPGPIPPASPTLISRYVSSISSLKSSGAPTLIAMWGASVSAAIRMALAEVAANARVWISFYRTENFFT